VGIGYFGALFAWYAVQVHQTKYLVEVGFSAGQAAWALGAVSLVGIPGQIALGHLSDRIGREIVWTISCLGFVLTYLLLLALEGRPSLPLLYLMVGVQGLIGYGMTSVVGAIPAEIFEGKHFGSIFGTLMLGAIAGGAAGPWALGALHDATGDYVAGFWLSLAFAALSIVAIWRASPGKVRAVAGRVR
jgi:MFS family permease